MAERDPILYGGLKRSEIFAAKKQCPIYAHFGPGKPTKNDADDLFCKAECAWIKQENRVPATCPQVDKDVEETAIPKTPSTGELHTFNESSATLIIREEKPEIIYFSPNLDIDSLVS